MPKIALYHAILIAFPFLAGAESLDVGRVSYVAHCTRCHGDDGKGGDRGPNIIDGDKAHVVPKAVVRNVILEGLLDQGMPAFKISSEEAESIANYVEALKSESSRESVQGDAGQGETFFFGKGKCADCHTVNGRGGTVGPDLSNLSATRSNEQIEAAVVESGASQAAPRGLTNAVHHWTVIVQLRDGAILRGIVKNESTFDLQIISMDGKVRLLTRDRIQTIFSEKSLIAKLDATRNELADLLAYLISLRSWNGPVGTQQETARKVPLANMKHPKLGDWPTYNGNENGNRFSPLKQINTKTVDSLVPKWIFPIGAPAGQGPQKRGVGEWVGLEVTPLVVDGVMYVTSVNEVTALDARAGRQIWHYGRERSPGLAGDAASGLNRGVALLGDKIFMVTDNAHLIAIHRVTGQLLWDVEMASSSQNYGATGAPLIVEDMVVIGVSGGDEGIRGFLDAYRSSTGQRQWRFWTVPAVGEPGSETWIGSALELEHGCASTWLTGSYDPNSGLIYWPTGNPCPDYNGDGREGDNLYSSSMLALEAKTGQLRWYYQFSPHDTHDWDATQTPILIDAMFRGQRRKLLAQANRNGFFYVIDRLTGKLLIARKFVRNLTWAADIDPGGRPIALQDQQSIGESVNVVCPSVMGAANWPATAYDPRLGLFYVIANEACDSYSKNTEEWKAGQSWFGGGSHRAAADAGGQYLRAINLQTGKVKWELPQTGRGSTNSGILATAGGLVFFGDNNGAFVAVDSKNGKPLWHFYTGQKWKASPMTYTVDGKQYIGVAAGTTIMVFGLL